MAQPNFFIMLPSEEIKERINVVDLIGETVQLKKAGTNFRGLCPFHHEKSPSFMVSPSKQIWHCFGCGLGGDIFEFIKQTEGVEFPEALQILASRAGIELRRPDISYHEQKDKKNILYEINNWAALFFAKVLKESHIAEGAREYLKKRGLKPETIILWQIGYSPADFHTFENFIVKKGYQKSEARDAGLLSVSEKDGAFFDRFRDRIMIPLFDIHGRVVGFTARILNQSSPSTGSGTNIAKYVNSPETLIYNKSQVVYGLHAAKNEIRKKDEVIIVEGNMDVVTCHEAGFTNVVGSSGTALTEQQLEAIKRFTGNISFAFDVDEAGLMATRRAVELALSMGFNVRIISLPRALAKDPDELIRKDPGLWRELMETAKNFLDFYFEAAFAKIRIESSADKKQVVADLLPLVALLPSEIDRSHYVQSLALRVGVDQKILLDFLNKILNDKRAGRQDIKTAVSFVKRKSKQEILESRVLGLLFKFPDVLKAEWELFQEIDFNIPFIRDIFAAAKPQILSSPFDLKNFLANNQKLSQEIELLIFAVENELELLSEWNLDDIKREFISSLKTDSVKRRMQQLVGKIHQAESEGRVEELKNLSSEFNHLSQEISKYAL